MKKSTMKVPGLSRWAMFWLLCGIPAHAGWVPVESLEAPLPAQGNYFGIDLLMEGTTLVAGESGAAAGGKSNVGAVVSFERDADGTWRRTQHLTYPDEPAQSGMGREIAMSGRTLLVSSITPAAGRVLVYDRSAPGAPWVPGQTLSGDTPTGYFGNSVALTGSSTTPSRLTARPDAAGLPRALVQLRCAVSP